LLHHVITKRQSLLPGAVTLTVVLAVVARCQRRTLSAKAGVLAVTVGKRCADSVHNAVVPLRAFAVLPFAVQVVAVDRGQPLVKLKALDVVLDVLEREQLQLLVPKLIPVDDAARVTTAALRARWAFATYAR
jgi:hypothetical protein